jgi:hypothetical protein
MDVTSLLTNTVLNYAGTWLPVTDPDFLAGKYGPHPANWGTVPSFALIPLGSAGQYGMVVDGFEFVPTLTAPAPVNIDGGLGFNTAVYSGASSQYKISINDDGSESVASLSGAKVPWAVNDTLVNINQIQFSDSTVVFDRPASGLILDTIDFQDVVNVTGLTQYDTSWYEFT